MKSKVDELFGVVRTFFLYKVADRIGTRMMEEDHENGLVIIGLLGISIFMVLLLWEQIGEVLYDEIENFHTDMKHDDDNIDLIRGGRESDATLLGFIFAHVMLFRSFLMLLILWLGQMFSVVVGTYITHFGESYESFDAIPITLAIGFFLLLAGMVVMPPAKRKRE